jgi:hypothetical protein
MPVVTHYEPKGGATNVAGTGAAFVPIELLLDASSIVRVGPSATSVEIAAGVLEGARRTDPVQAGPFTGAITAGSTKVRVG